MWLPFLSFGLSLNKTSSQYSQKEKKKKQKMKFDGSFLRNFNTLFFNPLQRKKIQLVQKWINKREKWSKCIGTNWIKNRETKGSNQDPFVGRSSFFFSDKSEEILSVCFFFSRENFFLFLTSHKKQQKKKIEFLLDLLWIALSFASCLFISFLSAWINTNSSIGVSNSSSSCCWVKIWVRVKSIGHFLLPAKGNNFEKERWRKK